jgi:hypothetical protein
MKLIAGKCPVNPALKGGVKGNNIKGNYLTGKPRLLGRVASLLEVETGEFHGGEEK